MSSLVTPQALTQSIYRAKTAPLRYQIPHIQRPQYTPLLGTRIREIQRGAVCDDEVTGGEPGGKIADSF